MVRSVYSVAPCISCSNELRTKEWIGWSLSIVDYVFFYFSANEFPSSFESIVRKILRLLYHVVAHIYHCHFREVALLGLHAHLNCVFAHLTLLNQRFNLIDPKETEILGDLEAALLGKLYICLPPLVANDAVLIDADYAMPPRDPRPNCATEYFLWRSIWGSRMCVLRKHLPLQGVYFLKGSGKPDGCQGSFFYLEKSGTDSRNFFKNCVFDHFIY